MESGVYMNNEQRAQVLLRTYGFDFDRIPKEEIRALIEKEITHYQEGSSEYIRVLCGYLYCIGDQIDIDRIEKAKYNIHMDVDCMIDIEWIDSLKNGGIEGEYVRSRKDIIASFIAYYEDFEANDE